MTISRMLASVTAAVGLIATSFVAAPAPVAQAFTGSDFNPGFIISDPQFYDNDAMSEHEIQLFLESQIAGVGGCATWDCLAVYRTDTTSRPADIRSGNQVICQAYQGGTQESVARIIFKVQQACGISARVLLVTLQKEQSLLTSRAPTSWQMKASMGYACPDSGVCDSKYYGIYNQLYMAAWQFKRYSVPTYDPFGYYQPGVRYIQYNPNPACGGTYVTIQNNATAALYNYTPYQPNAQSLSNLYGSGGSCGAHGNRNFWTYYYNWFGNPTGIVPAVGSVTRIGGSDRFDSSALMSRALPFTPTTVYVASGLDFPDGLSGAAVAGRDDAALVLVNPTAIPASVAAELHRISPARIVVLGGESAVSADVFTELQSYAPEVVRLSGPDRFATSLSVASTFPAGTTTAYIATGLGFADALSAGSAAAAADAPIILVDGSASTVSEEFVSTLQTLGVMNVVIAGGPASVSPAIEQALSDLGLSVRRLGGDNRFETAGLIALDGFGTSATVYLANAQNFPDALAGSALAAATNSALLLAPPWCVQRSTAQDIVSLGASSVVLLGGTTVLGSGVSTFVNCD